MRRRPDGVRCVEPRTAVIVGAASGPPAAAEGMRVDRGACSMVASGNVGAGAQGPSDGDTLGVVDLSRFEPYFDRNQLATVGVYIEGDGEQPFYLASGVLVTLGQREFVFTAGHNVWNEEEGRLATIAVGRPPDGVIVIIRPGDGSAGRVYCRTPSQKGRAPEPDVAVVELTAKTLLPRVRRPFGEEEIAFFDTNQVTQDGDDVLGIQLVATGIPAHHARLGEGLKLDGGAGTRANVETPMVSMRVSTIPMTARPDRFRAEPKEGRGLHVLISARQEDAAGTVSELRRPHGFSGGPVVSPTGAHGLLVGLMRGVLPIPEGWDMWCEPAAEAARLLIDHEDGAVAAAARRVWDRYEEARSRAPKRPTIVRGVAG